MEARNGHRQDWDHRAREDPRGYTASYDHESEEKFARSGIRDGELIFGFSGLDLHRPHGAALEIGCGIGRLLPFMAERFARVVGADISPEMLRQAGERIAEAGRADRVSLLLVEGDGAIPTQERFDFIYSFTVFQHIPRRFTAGYIAQIGRRLSPGGVAVVHFVEPYGPRRWLQALLHIDPPDRDSLHFRYFRRAQIERLSRRCGLRIDAYRKLGFYGLHRLRPLVDRGSP